ncbi:CAZyme family GH43 [Paecilomyces variotii]|nr:CAZyme family GH43 [Paecilomyces variotii]KAJ9238230.1 CAZyme family GH43 [Paecilomyces variotii]KAJ9271638.1 CAZyme family GH43 [Paecilomyces variotii]KAJ9314303.1 CAZyme family GH43 [Paecilomyces variotii]
MWPSFSSNILGLALLPLALASPFQKRASGPWMALDTDFPDPSFVGTPDGTWYAFGTNGNGKRVQVASSSDFQKWTLLDKEALPTLGGWETDVNHWAPHVIMRNDGRYVMYYSGEAKSDTGHHCVGAAISQGTDPSGPYIPQPNPFACNLDKGGSIDPAGFLDSDGTRYVVYKVDGNSIGNGGDCNNGVAPIKPTPIMLQKVKEDGVTPVGDPVQILDRDSSDGPLVEAPNLILHQGTYFLFYSTHCFTDPKYDVRYATATSITGPYTKTNTQLLKTGEFGMTSPGGGTVSGAGDKLVLHSFCEPNVRCAYAANISIKGKTVTVL